MKFLRKFNESYRNKRALIVHGYGTGPELDADGCFYPWMKTKLERVGYEVELPNLPGQKHPIMEDQVEYLLDRYPLKKDIIISHSLGVPTALKFVERLDYKVKALFLVGGFIDLNFHEGDPDIEGLSEYSDWKFDFDKIKRNVGTIYVLRPKIDTLIPEWQTKTLASKLKVPITVFQDMEDHAASSVEPVLLRFILDHY